MRFHRTRWPAGRLYCAHAHNDYKNNKSNTNYHHRGQNQPRVPAPQTNTKNRPGCRSRQASLGSQNCGYDYEDRLDSAPCTSARRATCPACPSSYFACRSSKEACNFAPRPFDSPLLAYHPPVLAHLLAAWALCPSSDVACPPNKETSFAVDVGAFEERWGGPAGRQIERGGFFV